MSKKERRELGEWAHSPVFNQRGMVTRMIRYLSECEDELGIIPSKKQLWRALFREEPYHDHRLRIELSHLQKLIENYLAISAFQKDRTAYLLRLSAQYRSRNLAKHFGQNMRKLREEQEANSFRDDRYHQQKLAGFREQYQWEVSRRRLVKLPIADMIYELDHSFILQKLRQACRVLVHQQVEGKTYDLELLPPVLQWVERRENRALPAGIRLYFYVYRMLSEKGLDDFRAFKTLLLEEDDLFQAQEQRDLFLYGINFCVGFYNTGQKTLLADHFSLYQIGLEKAYLLHDKQITTFTYQNVVTLGLILERYDWIAFFIEQFSRYLPTAKRKDLQSYTAARLAYARRQYDRALEYLQQTQYDDLLMQLSARILLVKIYFTTDAYEALESQIHACEVFIRRKPELGYHRANYRNMLTFVRRILTLAPTNSIESENLRQEITEEKALAERAWLLEQLV